MRGHTVLQLAVAPLEEWVRERTRHYDAGFVSQDPRFGHAHITALAPFLPEPDGDALGLLAGIAAETAPIDVDLAHVAQFPDGIIHLVPEPADPFERLTHRLVETFPDCPPYGGRFGPRVRPHLTLDAVSSEVDVASTRASVGHLLPVRCLLETLQLTWWESGACRVLGEWSLTGSPRTM